MLNLYPLRRPGKRSIAVLNIAHRGARAFAPENTLAAFAKAKTFGCRMFELDVRLSLDGELMVHHDDQLLRCTDVQAKFPDRNRYDIWDFTCDELSRLDAGRWYIAQLLLPGPQRQAFLQTLTEDELIEAALAAVDQALPEPPEPSPPPRSGAPANPVEPPAPPRPASPTLAQLEERRRPQPKTVCEGCPNSVWFASPSELTCYCRVMFLVTWSTKDPSQINLCDGIFLGREQE